MLQGFGLKPLWTFAMTQWSVRLTLNYCHVCSNIHGAWSNSLGNLFAGLYPIIWLRSAFPTCDGSLILFWVEIQLDFGLNSQQMWLVVGWDVYWIYFRIIPQLEKASRISYRRLVGIFGNGWLIWMPNMCVFQTCSYCLWNKVHCSLAVPDVIMLNNIL